MYFWDAISCPAVPALSTVIDALAAEGPAEVQQAINLPPEEVKRYLISLSCGKAKVRRAAASY